jgi:hypothetical protein
MLVLKTGLRNLFKYPAMAPPRSNAYTQNLRFFSTIHVMNFSYIRCLGHHNGLDPFVMSGWHLQLGEVIVFRL